jgi:hypothetical protein
MSTASKPASKRYAKFCAYCKAKGLSEAEFTSHFVKDAPGPKGKVCCPELLKNECGYCHEIGHTPKHCPKLKARDARRRKAKAAAAKRAKAQKAFKAANQPAVGGVRLMSHNSFAALASAQAPPPPRRVEELRRPRPCAPVPSSMNFIAAASGASREAAEIVALKAQLAKAQQALAAAQVDSEPFVGEQTMEQTAAGEAFFDNALDAEDAVAEIAALEQPALVRQSHVACDSCDEGACGVPGIALPADADLDADFGAAPSGDGWGSDED